MNKIIIFDNHLHLREYGRFIDAVKEFKKVGGTHFILCQLPMVDLVIKNKSYRDAYEITLKMVEKIKSNIEIGVFVTLGPYPVDYIKLNQHFGRKKAIEIMKNGIDIAKDFCDEKKSVAIGEIGRPHFNVDKQTMEDSNYVLSYAMKRAAEGNIPIVIHSESTTSKNCKEFVEMGKKEGLKPEKIIKHFSPPLIYKKENFGLFPSVLASTKNLKIAFKKGTRFLMETDYIDDPLRPGAVLGPKSVPKKTLYMYENKEITEDQIYKVHKENPERIYNINLD
jgi:TatD-related deoxyribonuclease